MFTKTKDKDDEKNLAVKVHPMRMVTWMRTKNSMLPCIILFRMRKKKQENDGVGGISSLFQRHCQKTLV